MKLLHSSLPVHCAATALLVATAVSAGAQQALTPFPVVASQTTPPLTLVAPNGRGRIIVPLDTVWDPITLELQDTGATPKLTMQDHAHDVFLSLSIVPSDMNSPEGCSEQVLNPFIAKLATYATLRNRRSAPAIAANGQHLATTGFLLVYSGQRPVHQENLFAFAAGPESCGEMQLTKIDYTPALASIFAAQPNRLLFEGDYEPTAQDYARMANIFYDARRDFLAAAVYYQRALVLMPNDAGHLQQRRRLTDRLATSYGIAGQLRKSYAVNVEASQLDPTYPMYFYNLACVDAELEDAQDARIHLQRAWDNRANLLPGDSFPDPTQDSSFDKLRKDRKFWKFAEELAKQIPHASTFHGETQIQIAPQP